VMVADIACAPCTAAEYKLLLAVALLLFLLKFRLSCWLFFLVQNLLVARQNFFNQKVNRVHVVRNTHIFQVKSEHKLSKQQLYKKNVIYFTECF